MAFQAPQRQQAHRPQVQVTTTSIQPSPSQTQTSPLAQHAAREWVLFSPHPSSGTLSTARTPRTIGRSQLSELGSLQTGDASFHAEEDPGYEDDETEDLDSLDDGLHAFGDPIRALRNSIGTDTVLPAHDGLGTFPGNSAMVQDQFWQHERYNPHRRRRSTTGSRRMQSPVMRRGNDLSTLQEEQDKQAEQEQWKMKRIEEWRLEQSRAILEEIEKETRRRRRASNAGASPAKAASRSNMPSSSPSQTREQHPAARNATATSAEDDGVLTRFTKKVIKDLMGIDDATLCYIFGEDLLREEEPISSTPTQSEVLPSPETQASTALNRLGSSWEERLIKRIARELGILVNQLTEHPGAFTTYDNIVEEHIPYAGITSSTTSAQRQQITTPSANPSTPDFRPTLRQAPAPYNSATVSSAWGIDESNPIPQSSQSAHLRQERDHWERDLDIKMVFNFLRSRFLRRAASSPTRHPALPTANSAPQNFQDRAQLIRQTHPLISRAAAANRQRMQQQQPQQSQAPPNLASVLGRRVLSEGSCASQSSKRTKTRTGSVSVSMARSQNYWDWGVGSDGAAASWGEA